MKVEYHLKTTTDLNDAVVYYHEQSAGLGDALRSEVYEAIDRVLVRPLRYAVVERDIRRCFVHRFPYSVLFRVASPDLVRILVIRTTDCMSVSVSAGVDAQRQRIGRALNTKVPKEVPKGPGTG